VEVQLHEFLTSALYGGEWSASRPVHLTSGESAPSTHLNGGLEGPRAGLDSVVRKNIPAPSGNRTPVVHYKYYIKFYKWAE